MISPPDCAVTLQDMGMAVADRKSNNRARVFWIPSFRDGPKDQTSDVQLHIGVSSFRFAFATRPGMTISSKLPSNAIPRTVRQPSIFNFSAACAAK
jgi:hypothetical protein